MRVFLWSLPLHCLLSYVAFYSGMPVYVLQLPNLQIDSVRRRQDSLGVLWRRVITLL